MFCFVLFACFFFRFNIKVAFYLVMQTRYNPGFTEEGVDKYPMRITFLILGKFNFLYFMGSLFVVAILWTDWVFSH